MQVATPEYVTAVMDLIESGDVSWDDADVIKVLKDAMREQSPKVSGQKNRNKSRVDAPSARLTSGEREYIPKIRFELAQEGIVAEFWELRVLVRGGKISYNGILHSYPAFDEWRGGR